MIDVMSNADVAHSDDDEDDKAGNDGGDDGDDEYVDKGGMACQQMHDRE